MEKQVKGIIITVISILSLYNVQAIIGYDCGSASANLTTLSLLNVEECDIPKLSVNTTQVYVQLLQLNEFESVRVLQCKIEVDRTVRKCGMFSHTMDVFNGKYSYIQEVSRKACQRMHFYGSYEISGTKISGLKPNSTETRPVTLAGSLDSDGKCSGGSYSDPYGTWADVIVLGTLKITLQDYIADVRINTNRVHLRSGVTCILSTTYCTDIEGGDTFWEPVPTDKCKFSSYGVLYEGNANKITDAGNIGSQSAYSLITQNTVFALASKGQYVHCGYTLTRTEHPKLIIFETTPGTNLFKGKMQLSNRHFYIHELEIRLCRKTYSNTNKRIIQEHIIPTMPSRAENVAECASNCHSIT